MTMMVHPKLKNIINSTRHLATTYACPGWQLPVAVSCSNILYPSVTRCAFSGDFVARLRAVLTIQVVSLQLEMEAVYGSLEDEALEIAPDVKGSRSACSSPTDAHITVAPKIRAEIWWTFVMRAPCDMQCCVPVMRTRLT